MLNSFGSCVSNTPKEFYDDYPNKRLYTKISLFELLKANNFTKIIINPVPHLGPAISSLFFYFQN